MMWRHDAWGTQRRRRQESNKRLEERERKSKRKRVSLDASGVCVCAAIISSSVLNAHWDAWNAGLSACVHTTHRPKVHRTQIATVSKTSKVNWSLTDVPINRRNHSIKKKNNKREMRKWHEECFCSSNFLIARYDLTDIGVARANWTTKRNKYAQRRRRT